MVNWSGPMPGERGQPAQEDVVDALEGAGLFQGHEVARLLDHADGGLIAAWVAADRAERLVGLGQVEADLAMADLLLAARIASASSRASSAGHLKQVVSEPLGGLGADAGQASQGGDQSIHGAPRSRSPTSSGSLAAGARGRAAQVGEEPSGRPPASDASDLAAASRALVKPALTAAATRSSSELCVAIGDQLGVDPDRHDLEPAVDLDRDRPAAGGPFHLELAQRFNRLLERLAQLAGVPHQFREHSQLVEHDFLFAAGVEFEQLPSGPCDRSSAAKSVGSDRRIPVGSGRASNSSTTF